MYKPFLALCFLTSTVSAIAQTSESVTIASGTSKDSVGIFQNVEQEAEFPGGIEAWRNFLYANLNPDAPFKELPKRTKHFKQTAIVQFIVCTDGTVCDVKVINDVLPSIKSEAEQAIKKSGKWEPARLNGQGVKAYRKQPITFYVNR